jgi:putative heme-binding domain-containing protein
LVFPEKNEPLRKLILSSMASHQIRLSAIRGVALDSDGLATLITLLNRHAEPIMFRRAAAERLAHPSAGPAGRAAILAVLPTAQNDLALTIASHLVLTEEGTAALIALVAQGKAPPALLRQHYVEIGLRDRSPALRAQVAALVKHLPTEDARLDAVINTRAATFAATKANTGHGAEVFIQNCAVCHRFRNSGGNLGPSLDGIASRSSQRVMEDILDPNRNVDPAFRLSTVTLKSGETLGGLNLRDHGEALTLTDPTTSQDFSVAKNTISAVAASVTSPMPPAFESVLPEKDFFDLLAYLLTPAKP